MRLPSDRSIFIAVTILMAASIFLRMELAPSRGLSADSYHYLRLAANIREGNGFEIPSIVNQGNVEVAAMWPPGYPAAIAAVSWLTRSPVYLAAQLFNIVILIVSLCLIYFQFPRIRLAAAAVLLSASSVSIFHHIWSEVPFCAGMLLLCWSLTQWLQTRHYIYAFLTLCFLLCTYFTRYAGIAVWPILGLVTILFIRKKRGWALAIACTIGTAAVAVNLWHNFTQTGLLTGYPRIPSELTITAWMGQVFRSLFLELNLFIVTPEYTWLTWSSALASLVMYSAIAVVCVKCRLKPEERERIDLSRPLLYFAIGLFYIAFICLLKLRIYVAGELSFRLLFPGVLLIMIGSLELLASFMTRRAFQMLSYGLLFAMLAALLLNGFILTGTRVLKGELTHSEVVRKTQRLSATIPCESGVIFPPGDLYYIRPDLYPYYPFKPTMREAEDWPSFIERVRHAPREIYVFRNILDAAYIEGLPQKLQTQLGLLGPYDTISLKLPVQSE